MDYLLLAISSFFLSLAYALYRVYSRVSISDIPGPDSDSFLYGNLFELFEGQVGDKEFELQDRYGGVARLTAPFGEEVLWLSDPKALQYILQTSGYRYPKQPERRLASRLVGDHGLTWSEGEVHKRQRKVMLPAFGSPEAKALVPIFSLHAGQITSMWKEQLSATGTEGCVINVGNPIARASLDSIGEAAFDYQFESLAHKDNELAKAYNSLLAAVFGASSKPKMLLQSCFHYMPMPFAEFLQDHLPLPAFERARANRKVAHQVAHQLIESKSKDLPMGKANRDIMSILVRANAAETGYARLSADEMIAQMRTIMVAGQETTASTITWALYEMARRPDIQHRLRAEIYEMEHTIQERGDTDFTVADFESMPYLQAVLREVLRFNPVIPHMFRMPGQDDIIPLSKPITTLSGKVIQQVPVRKGMRIAISVPAYNRDQDLWGDDAHEFNPDRFFNSKVRRGPTVGVYGNIVSFSGGLRACIGWRFAIYEIQAFLVELISNFEFMPSDKCKRVRREHCLVMVPTLEGEMDRGMQMPLKVSLASRD